jgi:predicted enzyme related to lactoylglutathione lyase
MAIVKAYPDGMFSWIDLNTTDIKAAHAFYSGLFGWEVDEQPIGDSGGFYTNFRLGGHSVAGGGQMTADMIAGGAPPVWTSYVNHRDIDSVAARIAEAGGMVFLPPMDVLDQGRLALAQDPTGAVFGLWQPWAHIGAQIVNQPNSLVWNELQTHDPEAARAFYNKVFGWTEHVDESGYIMWHDDGRVHCGGLTMGAAREGVPAHWLVYFLAEDVEAMARRAVELGGSVVFGPTNAGEMGRVVVLADPQGARFALIRFNGPVDAPPGTTDGD